MEQKRSKRDQTGLKKVPKEYQNGTKRDQKKKVYP